MTSAKRNLRTHALHAALALAVLVPLATPLAAQTAREQRKAARQEQRQEARGNGAALPNAQRRAALEQRFRMAGEQLVRQRLNLNDGQMQRLRAVNAGIAPRRNALVQQERDVRMQLRAEMARGQSADQSRVASLMQQARSLQSDRFALQEEEQRQLGAFLSPVQVAQYYGLQTQIRQRLRAMQGADGAAGDATPE